MARASDVDRAADSVGGRIGVEIHGDGPRADAHRAAVLAVGERTGWTLHDVTSGTDDVEIGVEIFAEPPSTAHDQVPMILRSLGAGRAVAIEAPWSLPVERLHAVVNAQRAAGVPVLYAEPLCHAPTVARTIASLGALGAVDRIESRHTGPDRGTGVAGVLATPVALVLLVARRLGAGDVTTVQPRLVGAPTTHPGQPEDQVRAVVQFEHGLRAVVGAQVAEARSAELQVSGPTGVLRTEFFPEPVLERNGDRVEMPRPTTSPPGLEHFGHVGQLEALAEAMRFGSAPITDAAFAVAVAEVVSRVVDPSR